MSDTALLGGYSIPSAPDYTNLDFWIAHPDRPDCQANHIVPGDDASCEDGVLLPLKDRPVDCFWIASTNYCANLSDQPAQKDMPPEPWLAPIPDGPTDEWCDADCSSQASATNIRCRIFAPRYRQNTIPCHNNFLAETASQEHFDVGRRAMEISYSDVDQAFDSFLSQTDKRPIIIASHSQGSMHAAKLLERFEKEEHLRERLICAYVLGPLGSMPMDKFERSFPSLHPCISALDSQCIVSFDAAGERCLDEFDKSLRDTENSPASGPVRNMCSDPPRNIRYGDDEFASPKGKIMCCTNPLLWSSSDTSRASEELHLGRAIAKLVKADGVTDADFGDCIARKASGVKLLSIEKGDVGTYWTEIAYSGGSLRRAQLEKGPGNHAEWEDYYYNIRENVKQRVDHFLKTQMENL